MRGRGAEYSVGPYSLDLKAQIHELFDNNFCKMLTKSNMAISNEPFQV